MRTDRRRVIAAGHDVVDSLAAGSVGDERSSPAVEMMAPGIHPAAGEHVQFQCLRAEAPDAAGVKPLRPVRRFEMAMNVDRLIEVEATIRPPAKTVHTVMRVLGSETGEHHAAF